MEMVLEQRRPSKKHYSYQKNDWHLQFLGVIQTSSSIPNLAEWKLVAEVKKASEEEYINLLHALEDEECLPI